MDDQDGTSDQTVVEFKRGIIVSVPELANVFGYSGRQIRDWIAEGAPVLTKQTEGKAAHRINTRDFHHWLIQRERARTRVKADAQDPRNRERAAKAGLAEIDLELKRRTLFHLEDFIRVTDNSFVEFKAELMRAFGERWNGSWRNGEELIREICNQVRDRLKGDLKNLEPAS